MATRTITAIYEHGVLRPISTVELPEHAQVELDVRSVTLAVDPIDAAFIAAGLIAHPPIVSSPIPGLLTTAERSALARRIGAGMALSQIILDEREGR